MNAIIMAAGTSTRFAPLSYEKPKGLLEVKGEVLIERQIRQLREAGIDDIIVIVGYKANMFDYLKDKFGVRLIMNEDYNVYNNTSSIIRVIDDLNETFICSSDNYFMSNVFAEKSEYSYYASSYASGETGEYCIKTDSEDNIIDVTIGGHDSWYMVGHAYFNRDFSTKFRKIMIEKYKEEETRKGYWEDLYLSHINELPFMKIRRYEEGVINEFDSLEELRAFDEKYINETGCKIFSNICSVLSCNERDLTDIHVLKNGMTNSSFRFTCSKDGRKYVYRHPGDGTEAFISRKSEYFSMQVAKELGIDKSFIYMDEEEGWKLSYFIDDARILDYHKPEELKMAVGLLARLHNANVQSEYQYRLWDQANDFLDKIKVLGKDDTPDFYELHKIISRLYSYAESDKWPECLNHCDALAANFLISDKNAGMIDMTVIDWEYSGQGDTAQDLGSFIACSDMNYEEALHAIRLYLGHEPNKEELRHFLAYTAIASYCWYLWAIYQESNGVDTGDFLRLWYDYSYFYSEKAEKLYLAE